MIVYLVTLVGVYDQGCFGVFTTREAAEAHGAAILAGSDGYHTIRVDEKTVGAATWPDPRQLGRASATL